MSPALILYGAHGSTNTDRVHLTLAEGGFTDYELVLVNLPKGEQRVGEPFLLRKRNAAFPPPANHQIVCAYIIDTAVCSPKRT